MANPFLSPNSNPTASNPFLSSGQASLGSNPFTSAGTKTGDLNTLEGLLAEAKIQGLEDKANEILDKNPKLSFLQRLGAGLGAFNTAQAISTGVEKGPVAGVVEYGKDIAKGLGSAITGKNFEEDRKTFSDIADQLGIKNSIAKFGIGLVGDILLDPTTYFGGAIAKGILGASKVGAGAALTGVGKLAPELEIGIKTASTALKDAFGKTFVYGYGTTKGVSDKLLETASKVALAKTEAVTTNLARLGTGILSRSQQEEVVYKMLSAKTAEFQLGRGTAAGTEAAAKIVGDVTDPAVAKAIEDQTARSRELFKIATEGKNNAVDPFEVYFPSLKKENVSAFINGTRQLRVGSEPYLKQFKNLLTNEQIVTNPAEAFATREFQILKDKIVRDDLNGLVKDFGKPADAFASAEEALAQGYRPVFEKGSAMGFYAGEAADKSFIGVRNVKPIGWLQSNDFNFINDLNSDRFTSIDQIAKATGFDALTALFKRSVTGLFAPFHVRNWVSGMIQNFETVGLDALNPALIAAGQKASYKLAKKEVFKSAPLEIGGKVLDQKEVWDKFALRFGSSSSYISDIGDATKDGLAEFSPKIFSKQALIKTVKTAGLSSENPAFKVARSVGNFIETSQKATAYLAALKQGAPIDDALRAAARAGFDYRALTPFESKVLRRIIPFYSFTRKNIELQLRTLGENPQRINQIMATFRNVGAAFGGNTTEQERALLPDFIKNSLGIKLPDLPDGIKQYIYSLGSPIEAFTNLIDGNPVMKAISMTNPLLKVPIEVGIGKDSFRNKDLQDVYDAREYSNAPQIIKDLLDITEVQKPVLEKNGAGKLVKVGEKKVYVADPVRLLIARSLFTSRGVSYLDEVFNGDLKGLAKTLKLTTGVKPTQVDLEQLAGIKERDQVRELQDLLLKRSAGVAQYTSLFRPKQ